jgi:hypothetical protein
MLTNLFAALRRLWERLTAPKFKTVRLFLVEFLGKDYDRLETHDKYYPGYDIASLHRAVASFRDDCCFFSQEIGATGALTLRDLFQRLNTAYQRNLMPYAPAYERVPTDVEEEGSFATNVLWLATMNADAGRNRPKKTAALAPAAAPSDDDQPEKIAIQLAVKIAGQDYWDGMDTRHVPRMEVTISIAARSRAVADRFFAEIEDRRKRLSIYRGKVIDPVVHAGGIHTIGFRAIQQVREDHLVLPEQVKDLIQRSIIGFYDHREVLEGLGIEMKRGVLFHSPPGTGKTSISLYLAGKLPNFTVCFVSGERLLYPREICRMARYLQPATIIFEDIDLVAQERNANGLATVLGELMNQIDGCEPTDQVLFIMTTNSLERLEHAVKNRPGRVDQIIEIPLPDAEQRQRLVLHFARNLKLGVSDLGKLLRATEGATPAMLKEIVKRAAVSAVERLGGKHAAGSLELTEADLLLATEQVRALRDPELVPGSFGFRERP